MTERTSEFYRPVATHDLPLGGRPFEIEAKPGERAAVARRFGIVAINYLRAHGVIRPQASGRRVKLEGHLFAQVVQTCVITLEPVTATIEVALERLYDSFVRKHTESEFSEAFVDLSDDLPAEPLSGDIIDIGAAAAEQLGLELDPYPKKPGAVFEGMAAPTIEPNRLEDTGGPFAGMAGWRRRAGKVG